MESWWQSETCKIMDLCLIRTSHIECSRLCRVTLKQEPLLKSNWICNSGTARKRVFSFVPPFIVEMILEWTGWTQENMFLHKGSKKCSRQLWLMDAIADLSFASSPYEINPILSFKHIIENRKENKTNKIYFSKLKSLKSLTSFVYHNDIIGSLPNQ